MDKKKVGDRIAVKASECLGTPEAMGTIVEVEATHYVVHIDGDDPEWAGPVTFEGEVLIDQ